MFDQLLKQINFSQWSWLLPWILGFSVITFVGSVIAGWLVLVHLPENYLTRSEPTSLYRSKSKLVNLFVEIVRNLLGLGFLLVGMVMLVTPGQGILSIVVGIILIEFPGKQKLIRKIVASPNIFKAINKIRKQANKPPLAGVESGNSPMI